MMTSIDIPPDVTTDASADHVGVLAEDPHVPERVIAAPVAGVFALRPPEVITGEGEIVTQGQVLATIERNGGAVDVSSPHTGFLMGLLALPGEHVRAHQPLAWIRTV
jgi:biotin carboxyl carrier protein